MLFVTFLSHDRASTTVGVRLLKKRSYPPSCVHCCYLHQYRLNFTLCQWSCGGLCRNAAKYEFLSLSDSTSWNTTRTFDYACFRRCQDLITEGVTVQYPGCTPGGVFGQPSSGRVGPPAMSRRSSSAQSIRPNNFPPGSSFMSLRMFQASWSYRLLKSAARSTMVFALQR